MPARRWYGPGPPKTCFVERKTHRDSWKGERSVKERFTLQEEQVGGARPVRPACAGHAPTSMGRPRPIPGGDVQQACSRAAPPNSCTFPRPCTQVMPYLAGSYTVDQFEADLLAKVCRASTRIKL